MLIKDFQPEIVQTLCQDEDKALHFIADVKWEDGFVCKKCGHTNYCSGKTTASRRCTRCKKEESATANTIFHNCKFPIHKAFFIIQTVCLEKRKFSAMELSEVLELNPMTCWKFRKRIQECVENQKNSSSGDVNLTHVLLKY